MTVDSRNLWDYELPECDVQEEKRNFPGFDKKEWYTLEELIDGSRWGGMTETDGHTSDMTDGPYDPTQKVGKRGRATKTSSKGPDRYNTERVKMPKGPHKPRRGATRKDA